MSKKPEIQTSYVVRRSKGIAELAVIDVEMSAWGGTLSGRVSLDRLFKWEQYVKAAEEKELKKQRWAVDAVAYADRIVFHNVTFEGDCYLTGGNMDLSRASSLQFVDCSFNGTLRLGQTLSYPNSLRFYKEAPAKMTRPFPDKVSYYGISLWTNVYDHGGSYSNLHNSIVKQSGLESFLKDEILVKRT